VKKWGHCELDHQITKHPTSRMAKSHYKAPNETDGRIIALADDKCCAPLRRCRVAGTLISLMCLAHTVGGCELIRLSRSKCSFIPVIMCHFALLHATSAQQLASCYLAERRPTRFSLLKLSASTADDTNHDKMSLYFPDGNKWRVRFSGYLNDTTTSA
jgi:hypothetical protein